MQYVLGIFVLMYVLLLTMPKYRAYIALTVAGAFIILGSFNQFDLNVRVIFESVDWNVLLMIAGTMGIVHLFIESKMPARLADAIIDKTPNVKWAIVALVFFTGFVSAFIDNVATVLMIAPIALTVAKRVKISPVPVIIAISVASNLQGAATLIGDTTSILLAGKDAANINFMQFFILNGKMGMFFITQIGFLAAMVVVIYIFRKEKSTIDQIEKVKVNDYLPTYLILSMLVLLIIASFFENKPEITNGLICMGLLIIGLGVKFFIHKDKGIVINTIKEIDYFTLLLLFGLFMVVGGVKSVGAIDEIGKLIKNISGSNIFIAYTIIVWISVLFSAVIDNIPYVMTMLAVVPSIAGGNQDIKYLLYFGLLVGATLGGNLTPIGASANIAGIGILRKEGYEVKTGTFMKISVPFTLVAVITGYILLWLVWGIK